MRGPLESEWPLNENDAFILDYSFDEICSSQLMGFVFPYIVGFGGEEFFKGGRSQRAM